MTEAEQRHTGGGNRRGTRTDFGAIRKLPSGRFQARYTANGVQYSAQTSGGQPTFETKTDAAAALRAVRRAMDAGTWRAPGSPDPAAPVVQTLGQYADAWLASRTDLTTRTRDLYRSSLNNHIRPTFGTAALTAITAADVRAWYATLAPDKPAARANAYATLKTILRAALADELIAADPCKVKGGTRADRAKEPALASVADLAALRTEMPERYRVAVDLGCWCSLRIGEVVGLQRADVEADGSVIRVRRSVVRTSAGREVKAPKTRAGVRTVHVPTHIRPALMQHLDDHAAPGRTGWLFPATADPSANVSPDVLREAFERVRDRLGLERITFHSLRGTGATFAALAGATVRELQDRLGHTTARMALEYQRVADDRPGEIAARMSALLDPKPAHPRKRTAP